MCVYIEMFHMDNSVLNMFAESSVSVVKKTPTILSWLKTVFPEFTYVLFTPVVDEDSASAAWVILVYLQAVIIFTVIFSLIAYERSTKKKQFFFVNSFDVMLCVQQTGEFEWPCKAPTSAESGWSMGQHVNIFVAVPLHCQGFSEFSGPEPRSEQDKFSWALNSLRFTSVIWNLCFHQINGVTFIFLHR